MMGYDGICSIQSYMLRTIPIARNIQWKSGSFETMKTDVGQKKPAT
jgi:hypothetical protein